jgi:hypothetical protein
MQKLLIMVLGILTFTTVQSQVTWQWAEKMGGTNNDRVLEVASDKFGNVYVCGHFQSSTITFGSLTLNKPISNSSYDLFYGKYDNAGNLIWMKPAGSSSDDWFYGITCDQSGGVYLVGSYFTTISFDSTQLADSSNGGSFIVKLDSLGGVLWTKNYDDFYTARILAVTVDKQDNVYVTGNFSNYINLDGFILSAPSPLGIHVVTAKFTSNGTLVFAKAFFGTALGESSKIKVDSLNNIYLCGVYQQGNLTFAGTTDSTSSGGNPFICKYDSLGSELWLETFGGDEIEVIEDFDVDANGNLAITGYFRSASINIGTFTLMNVDTISFQEDYFIAYYNNIGVPLWAQCFGAPGTTVETGMGIVFSSNDNLFVTGYFSNTVSIGGIPLTSGGFRDFFLASYNSMGNVQWAVRNGGSNSDLTLGITITDADEAIIFGQFESNSMLIGGNSLTNSGDMDGFFAKTSIINADAELKLNETSFDIITIGSEYYLLCDNNSNGKFDLLMTDILGNTTYEESLNLNSSQTLYELNIPSVSNGIYFFNLSSPGRNGFVKKIIYN